MRAARESGLRGSLMRLRGFLHKEMLQILRDPSSMPLAVVMPVALLFLFGYGVSLNPERVPIAVVFDDSSPSARDRLARFEGSHFLVPVAVRSRGVAEELVQRGQAAAIVQLQDDFEGRLLRTGSAPLQVLLDGVDSNRAQLIRGYVAAAANQWSAVRSACGETSTLGGGSGGGVRVVPRTWYNPTGESRNFLVPGLITLSMTLIGIVLTALVIVREWERGTMEAILATPLRTHEFFLGKILPYFALGMLGLAIAIVTGLFLFGVPLRGSLFLLIACSALFLLACLGLGLAFLAALPSQFVAAQASVVAWFLPAFFFSGMLFDLESAPLPIRAVSHIFPARYFVEISHTLFLAGNIPAVLAPASLALAAMAAFFLTIARLNVSDRLE